MTEYSIASIMRADGPTLTPDTPIRRAAALLVEARVPAAVVLADDGALAGILTQIASADPGAGGDVYASLSVFVEGRCSDRAKMCEGLGLVGDQSEPFTASAACASCIRLKDRPEIPSECPQL